MYGNGHTRAGRRNAEAPTQRPATGAGTTAPASGKNAALFYNRLQPIWDRRGPRKTTGQ
jgi:hypothetical protein